MSQIVIDSGVLIASVFPETLTAMAQGLLHQLRSVQTDLHAPVLLNYELIAVSRKVVYQGRVTREEGRIARDQLMGYPVALHFDTALLTRAYELAEMLDRPSAYDAQYLALAERLECDFWTTDVRLVNSARRQFTHIRSLADWRP